MVSVCTASLVFAVFYWQLIAVDSFATPNNDFLLTIDENSVAVGSSHVCVVEQKHGEGSIGGRVACWGHDYATGHDDAPTDIEFVQVIAGASFSCGITLDQTAFCWGSISGYQPGLYTQLTAASQAHFFCGVMTNGRINCFGDGYPMKHYQAFNNEDIKFVQISCGIHHCCALDSTAYPHCIGDDSVQQSTVPNITHSEYLDSVKTNGRNLILKQKAPEQIEDEEISFTRKVKGDDGKDEYVEAISKMQFRQLSVGTGLSCGITLIGSHLRCWGIADDKMYPRYAMGPFRVVSVGDMGLCVITAELEEGQEHHMEVEVDIDALGIVDKKALIKRKIAESKKRKIDRTPFRPHCWGTIQGSHFYDPNKFDAWDTITLGNGLHCGVSMDSELTCGGIFPEGFEGFHEHFLVA